LFERPTHTFVGYFIGSPGMNLIEVQPQPGGVGFASTRLPLSEAMQKRIAESTWKTLKVGIRPEFIHVWDEPFDEALRAKVVHVEDLGTYKILTLNLDGVPLKVRLAEDKPVPEGTAYISFPAQWLMVYADDFLLETQAGIEVQP
jgi:glycerol transport system ATP-binding protein